MMSLKGLKILFDPSFIINILSLTGYFFMIIRFDFENIYFYDTMFIFIPNFCISPVSYSVKSQEKFFKLSIFFIKSCMS